MDLTKEILCFVLVLILAMYKLLFLLLLDVFFYVCFVCVVLYTCM